MTDEERKTLRHSWRTLGLIYRQYAHLFSRDDRALIVRACEEAAKIIGPDQELAVPENWPDNERERWRAIE